MVTDSLDAFVRRDLTLAWSVIEYDDVVDRLFDECKSDLIAEIAQNPEDGERVLDVLMIAKSLRAYRRPRDQYCRMGGVFHHRLA